MAICRNVNCPLSYHEHDGIVLVGLVRALRVSHNANRAPAPAIIERLRELAPRFYQAGPLWADCGQGMAIQPGPAESQEVNDLLQSFELLQMNGALP